jgi:hypothetical protein
MRATRKKRVSTTWRLIVAGRESLQHGLIRRVCNGASTEIWGHRWISDHFGARPITPRQEEDLLYVSELLTENGTWNGELIRKRFLPIDAQAILRQPVGRNEQDFLAWDREKFGAYTVKSAYKLFFEKKNEVANSQQPSSSNDAIWKAVWKLQVPPKVKVFWWRGLHEFLPARQILWRRHIEPVANCEACGAPEESIRHVLLDCTVAKDFWSQTRLAAGVKIPSCKNHLVL